MDTRKDFWSYDAHPDRISWMAEGWRRCAGTTCPTTSCRSSRGGGIDGAVALQPRDRLGETAFLLELAARHRFIQGVVVWLDLCAPGIEPAVEAAARDLQLKDFRMLAMTIATPASPFRTRTGAASPPLVDTTWTTTPS